MIKTPLQFLICVASIMLVIFLVDKSWHSHSYGFTFFSTLAAVLASFIPSLTSWFLFPRAPPLWPPKSEWERYLAFMTVEYAPPEFRRSKLWNLASFAIAALATWALYRVLNS